MNNSKPNQKIKATTWVSANTIFNIPVGTAFGVQHYKESKGFLVWVGAKPADDSIDGFYLKQDSLFFNTGASEVWLKGNYGASATAHAWEM